MFGVYKGSFSFVKTINFVKDFKVPKMLQDLRNFSFSNFPPAVDFLDNAMFIYHYCYIIRASFD